MWDYLFDPNPNNPPLEQRVSPARSIIFTLEDQMLHRDTTLHCAFAPLGDLHRRTSSTHTTKFGGMALIPLVGFGTPSQKTSLLGRVASILIYQDHPHV